MTEDLVKVLELADAHIGWVDCTLENVHKEIRATLAAHRARQESRLPCCGYKNPTMGTFNGCQKCIADCADHLIKTSQEAAGELEEAISIVQSHFMIREHTSEQRSDAYAAKADKAMQTLIRAASQPVQEVTVEEFERECSKYRTDCRVMADYLITVYPNGLRIVKTAQQGER